MIDLVGDDGDAQILREGLQRPADLADLLLADLQQRPPPALDRGERLGRERLVVGEVEPELVGTDVRTGLLHVGAKDLPQRRLEPLMRQRISTSDREELYDALHDAKHELMQAAAGVGLKRYLTNLVYQNTNATATVYNVLRGTTVIFTASVSV